MSNDDFDEIINTSSMREWMADKANTELTVGDLYELLNILSSIQVQIHAFLKGVISAIIDKNKPGKVAKEMPGMNQKQIAALMNILDASMAFLEEELDNGS